MQPGRVMYLFLPGLPAIQLLPQARAGLPRGMLTMSEVPPPTTEEYELEVAAAERYRNALLWVRTIAGMHYWGGAFDPEHMRDLANLAANVLNGTDLPDHSESMARAQEQARLMASSWGKDLGG